MSDDFPITIASWRRNSRETIRVQIAEYQGRAIIDLRSWYEDGAGGELKPGRHGLALSVRHLPQLADAVGKALAVARECGLLNDQEPPPRQGPKDKTAADRMRRYRAAKRNAVVTERDSASGDRDTRDSVVADGGER